MRACVRVCVRASAVAGALACVCACMVSCARAWWRARLRACVPVYVLSACARPSNSQNYTETQRGAYYDIFICTAHSLQFPPYDTILIFYCTLTAASTVRHDVFYPDSTLEYIFPAFLPYGTQHFLYASYRTTRQNYILSVRACAVTCAIACARA